MYGSVSFRSSCFFSSGTPPLTVQSGSFLDDATSVVALTMTSTQHIPAQALTPPTAELQYRIPDQPSLDGNTVDMDRERTQFADNSLQYQMSLSALSGQIKGMMNVLQSGN